MGDGGGIAGGSFRRPCGVRKNPEGFRPEFEHDQNAWPGKIRDGGMPSLAAPIDGASPAIGTEPQHIDDIVGKRLEMRSASRQRPPLERHQGHRSEQTGILQRPLVRLELPVAHREDIHVLHDLPVHLTKFQIADSVGGYIRDLNFQ